jgi:hypothetical protein
MRYLSPELSVPRVSFLHKDVTCVFMVRLLSWPRRGVGEHVSVSRILHGWGTQRLRHCCDGEQTSRGKEMHCVSKADSWVFCKQLRISDKTPCSVCFYSLSCLIVIQFHIPYFLIESTIRYWEFCIFNLKIVQHSAWLQTGRLGFDSRHRQMTFPVASVSRPALQPTQPPIRWVPVVLSPG